MMYSSNIPGYKRSYLSREGAASSQPECSSRGSGNIRKGLIAGIGGLALLLAVESGVLEFKNERTGTLAAGIGCAGVAGGLVGLVYGSYKRFAKDD